MEKQSYNPYQMHQPAQGPGFIGRHEELNSICNSSVDNIVFGYSRWGKTSLMTTAAKMLENRGQSAVYIPNCRESAQELFMTLCLRLRKSSPGFKEQAESSSNIEELFLNLDSHLSSQGKRLYLLLDETASIFAKEKLASEFRAYNQELQQITFVYSLFPHVFAKVQEYSSRFQDSASMIPLSPFNLSETASLVRLCLSPELMHDMASDMDKEFFGFKPYEVAGFQDFTTSLYHMTGGFPFLEQGLMETAVNQSLADGNAEISPETLDQAYNSFYPRAEEQIAHMWNALTPLQIRIIKVILQDTRISKDDLAKRVHAYNPSVYLGSLNPLSDRGIGLIKGSEELEIRGKLMNDALGRFIHVYGVKDE